LDLGYISKEIFEKIYLQAEKVSKIKIGFITYLLQQEKQTKKLEIPDSLKKPKKPNKLNKLRGLE